MGDNENIDKRPYEERLADIQDALKKLCLLYRIEILPTLGTTVNALVAQLRFLDMNNPEIMKKYGLEAPDGTPIEKDSSLNPVRN